MAYTISLHHGGGVANRGHNIRKESAIKNQTHIKAPREGMDRDIEIWKDMTEAQAYEKIFGEAQKRYNEKQTRAERKIRSYHAEVEKNSNMHTSYECIVQIGSKNNQVDESIERHILRDFTRSWSARNPNLFLFGAYFHKDEEGGNHLHLDYIPVAHGYTRGLDTQAGLVKALGEMGYHKQGKLTAQTQWQQKEREYLEELCRDFGIFIEHPQRGKDIEHLHTEVYKAEKTLENVLERVKSLEHTLEPLEDRKRVLKGEIERLEGRVDRLMSNSIRQSREDLETLMQFIREEGLEKQYEKFLKRLHEMNIEWDMEW